MTRTPIPVEITEQRIIAIARRLPSAQLEMLSDVLLANGLGVLEVTIDGEDGFGAIARLQGSGLLIGAGTVMSVAEAEKAVGAGASFLVSPHTDEAVVRWAVENGIPVMPGALTPTEIARAWDLGSSAVKLFPASIGGPSLLRTLRGPLGNVTFIPTGGIGAENAKEYLEAGAVAVGVGSWLTGDADPNVVRERAELLVGLASGR